MTTNNPPHDELSDERQIDVQGERILNAIQDLIELCGGTPNAFESDLVTQLIQTGLKLLIENHDTGQLKLMTRALKEMRHAYRIFNRYRNVHRVSIFGSARTPEDHPDYLSAKAFSIGMADRGWMCITGAANGIMKAGLEGSKRQSSFGLSIRLPFEIPTNTLIEGDSKLIIFRYFFTRKLMFISHSNAVAVFPGGFGTLDELFEVLTLIQTGKSSIIPVVLIEGTTGIYWKHWENYIQTHLLTNGWISPEDTNFYYLASSAEDALKHIERFYHRYHSSRYVRDILVLRLLEPLNAQHLEQLNQQFSILIKSGKMEMSAPLPEETDYLELPRLIFRHTRQDFGILRKLIDQINAF